MKNKTGWGKYKKPDIIIDNLTPEETTQNQWGITAKRYEWYKDNNGKPFRITVW